MNRLLLNAGVGFYIMPLEELESDLERAQYLQDLLLSMATGGAADGAHYQTLRTHFIRNAAAKKLLPEFVRTCRDVNQFWQFIKFKFKHYAERREYIWTEFAGLLEHLESTSQLPADEFVSETLRRFDEESVHAAWTRALERRTSDPEGAITTARTLLETVCKHILDASGVEYDSTGAEMHELYRLVAKTLNLSPSQHTEEVFKQILGGCSAVVNGLGTLRNRLGDAHGKGKSPVRPSPRHAELAVNLAGSMAVYLVSTWDSTQNDGV